GKFQQQVMAVKSIDKRTGKLLYDDPEVLNGPQFHEMKVDMKGGRVELTGQNMKIVHLLETSGTGAPEGGTKPGGGGQKPDVEDIITLPVQPIQPLPRKRLQQQQQPQQELERNPD